MNLKILYMQKKSEESIVYLEDFTNNSVIGVQCKKINNS